MKEIWKWIERVASIVVIVSGFKVIGMVNIFTYFNTLWTQLTAWQFLLILSTVILLCSFIMFLVKLHKKINTLIDDFNDLKKWIGLFSYKDKKGSYTDLKGKINRYIAEELEKEKKTNNP
jgi:cytochrome b subunit of formate dehydrogenase